MKHTTLIIATLLLVPWLKPSAADKVHVHDLIATILHLLGIDHERLIGRYDGRDFRLTDAAGRVVNAIFA